MINPISPPAGDNVQLEFRNGHMRKIISFMHLSLDGFVAVPNGEMKRIKVDEEVFDHAGKLLSEGDNALTGNLFSRRDAKEQSCKVFFLAS